VWDKAVGREGRHASHTLHESRGAWAEMEVFGHTLVEDLLRPTAEVTRPSRLLPRETLTQTGAARRGRAPLEGEFMRSANNRSTP